MGLIANIYKHRGRSFDGGRGYGAFDDVTLVNVEGPFDPTPVRPAAMLVRGNLPGTVKVVMAAFDDERGEYLPVRPINLVGPMMGGCYVDTSDGRLAEAIAKLAGSAAQSPVPLHDRWETPAEYEALST